MDKKVPALAIALMAKKKQAPEEEEEDIGNEVRVDAGRSLIEALDRKDPLAVYEAFQTLVDLC